MKKILSLSLVLLSLAVSSAAQSRVVPIVEMRVAGLLGGVENGKFLDAKTTAEKLAAEQRYTIFPPGGKTESLLLKKPINEADVCDGFFGIDYEGIESDARYKNLGVALGAGFGWKPQPRAVKRIALDNAAYVKIMNDFLRTKRIRTPLAKLNRAFSVDLDGDGRDEIVLAATRVDRYFQPRPKRKTYDAYSVVLIRKSVGGKMRNIVVDGSFDPQTDAIYDGYVYDISSFVDLNGDGRMEIIEYGEYYEGSGISVFQLVGNKAVSVDVLGAGCSV